MARASSDDACIICEQVPCECRKKKAAPKARPRIKQDKPADTEPSVPAPAPRASAIEKMRARVARGADQERFALPATESGSAVGRLSVDDAAMLHAVRILSEAFEIHPDDLKPFKPYLDQPPTIAERAAHWKRRLR